jgi:hypothetical protein
MRCLSGRAATQMLHLAHGEPAPGGRRGGDCRGGHPRY